MTVTGDSHVYYHVEAIIFTGNGVAWAYRQAAGFLESFNGDTVLAIRFVRSYWRGPTSSLSI